MSFLHAWAIAFGVAAIVPVILHLRRRRTDRRISFPALRYLSWAEDARSRSFAASDVVLLATRIGLLLALAFAAAGPLLGRGGASDHSPTDLAIIIDNSASTGRLVGDRPLFTHLIDLGRQSLEAARPEDRIWIFPTLGAPVAAGVGAARAAEAIGRIELSDGAADLGEVVARASAAIPADGERQREVQLLSDLQRGGFRANSAGGTPTDETAAIVAYVAPPPVEPNAVVAHVELTGGTTVPSGIGHGVIASAQRFEVDGTADSAGAGEASMRLELDGRIAGAARTPWGTSGTLGLPELAVGTHRGHVEVDPQGARADDVRFFSIHVVPPPAVRFVGPDSSFVRVGVETLRQAGRLDGGENPSVTIVEGVRTFGGDPVRGTRHTLVLVPPADPVDLPAFNQMLTGLQAPWTLQIDPERGGLALSEPDAAFSFSGIRVRYRYLVRSVADRQAIGDTTILRTEDDEPWLVRAGLDDRTFLLLASPLVPTATDLPAHPAVIPFLEALLVQWSHVSGWPSSDFDAGSALALPAWAASVTAPDGSTVSVEGGARFTPVRAGVYRVAARGPEGGVREAHFAVNVPESELDPRPIDLDRLGELFPGRPVFTAGPASEEWSREVFRARRGHDAAPWLIALALALAVVELFLATPGRAKKRRQSRGWVQDDRDIEANTGAT